MNELIYFTTGIRMSTIAFCLWQCHQRWDCTGARMRLFCGSDGNTYTSRCHIRLTECLTDTDISIDHAGQCGTLRASYLRKQHAICTPALLVNSLLFPQLISTVQPATLKEIS